MKLKQWLFAVGLFVIAPFGNAGEFDIITSENTIAFSGKIVAGDTERLADILRKKNHFHLIYLDSAGGSIEEAIRMAQIIKTLYLSVRVTPGKHCSSACFFMFIAGSGREASPVEMMTAEAKANWDSINASIGRTRGLPGFIGLHRPYISNISSLENNQTKIMKKISIYLENQMISRRLIDLMMSRPSNDIYWLTFDDLKELGDYPPEQEELFIKKCGYDKNYLDKLSRNPNSAEKNGALLAQSDKATTCIVGITSDGQRKGWEKLKAGWLPPKQKL